MGGNSSWLGNGSALGFGAVLRALPLGDPVNGEEDRNEDDSEDDECRFRFNTWISVGGGGRFVEPAESAVVVQFKLYHYRERALKTAGLKLRAGGD